MLQVSKRVEYGLQAALHLAQLPDGQRTRLDDIASAEQIPRDFLAKILRALVDAKLVKSLRGPHGGFALALPAPDISYLDVVEAVDGPIAIAACSDLGEGCEATSHCMISPVWREGELAFRDVLRRHSLRQSPHD